MGRPRDPHVLGSDEAATRNLMLFHIAENTYRIAEALESDDE